MKKSLILYYGIMGSMFAQDIDEHSLNKQVVDSTRVSSAIEKTPGNVTIVNKKEMKDRSPQKVNDFIKNYEGIHINNDAGLNPRPAITIRGISNGTLIMLDGVILNDLEGESRILDELSLYDVSKVEVLRGPFSNIYGTGAIGGVVNFITEMPKEFEARAVIGYGNAFKKSQADMNLVRGYLSIGDVLFKKLKIRASYGFTTSGGYPSVPAFGSASDFAKLNGIGGYRIDKAGNYIAGNAGRREYVLNDGRIKAQYDWGENDRTDFMASISNHHYDFVDPYTTLRDSDNSPVFGNELYNPFVGSGYAGIGSYTHYLGSIVHTHTFQDSSKLKVSFSTINLSSYWLDGDGSVPAPNLGGGKGYSQDIYTTSNYLEGIYNKNFDKHLLSIAIQARYMGLDQLNHSLSDWKVRNYDLGLKNAYGGKAVAVGGFIQLDSYWNNVVNTTIGLRYDYWENFDNYTQSASEKNNIAPLVQNNISPKASINYNPFDFLVLKASIGSAFRVPTLREIFRISTPGSQWINNPNLKPENGLSFDFGGDINTFLNGVLKIYYFQTELDDMIYRSGNGKSIPYQNQNAGHGRINGIEIGYIQPLYENLSLNINYTWTNAKITKNSANPKTQGKFIANTPEHMAHIGLLYGGKYGVYGSLEGNFQSSSYSDDINSPILSHTFGYYDPQLYFNAKLGYVFKNNLDLSMSFLNFTNNRYYDFYQVAGASFFAQANIKF